VRAALVVGQLALSQALLVGGGLLTMSLARLLDRSPGFEPAHAMAAQYYLPDAVYTTHEQMVGFHEEALRRVRALPGVAAAGLITPLPFGFGDRQGQYEVEGHAVTGPTDLARADEFFASPGALRALGIPLMAGRFFDDHDRRDAPAVAVVDSRFAREWFPEGSAVGRRIRPAHGKDWLTIVGVVGHVDAQSLTEPGRVQVYTPMLARSAHFASLVVRTTVDPPLSVLPAIRREIRALDADLPLFNTTSLAALVDASTSQARMGAVLFGGFALVAWGLAAIGLWALVAYLVTARRRELGIRLALGAQPSALVRSLVAGGARLTAAGLAAGLVLGVVVARALAALLVDVGPLDPLVFGAASLALALAGVLAAYFPARTASRIDPLVAIRAE
jgi:putative ABC transport system permease protein